MSNKNILIMGFGTQAVRYLECAKLNECEISAGELEEFFLCDYNKEYVKLIDNRSKRQTMRQSLKSTPPIIGDVASCIRPEDYLTMA